MRVADELDVLRDLQSVSLDEVTAVADLQTRKDRKYLVPTGSLGVLVADIGSRTRMLTIDDAHAFRYESVYFDTVDLASYLGAARRRPRRFKVRTRAYLDSGDCVLEVKTRDARARTVKHRYPYDTDCRTELTGAGRRFLYTIPQAAATVELLRPTLTTAYRRSTLILDDTVSRATVDVDLMWTDRSAHQAHLRGLVLVETKTSGPPCALDRVLWRRGHRPVTISKYCTGLAALTPELPANKWNRVLRRHFDWHRG